jgi:tetratricopeptide (TPR) repeat protein/TolB-like protein
MARPPPLLERIQRRKLFHWAAAYVGFSVVLAGTLEAISAPWRIADVAIRTVHILLLAGFFALLIIGWYHGEQGRQRVTAPELLLLGLLLGAAWLLLDRAGIRSAWAPGPGDHPVQASQSEGVSGNGIRVGIPFFEDRTPGGGYQYLADGVATAVMEDLGGIPGLSVTSAAEAAEVRSRGLSLHDLHEVMDLDLMLTGFIRSDPSGFHIHAALVRPCGSGAQADEETVLWDGDWAISSGDPYSAWIVIPGHVLEGIRAATGMEVRALRRRGGASQPSSWLQVVEAEGAWSEARRLWDLGQKEAALTTYVGADQRLGRTQDREPKWATPSLRRSSWALWFADHDRSVVSAGSPEWLILAVAHADRAVHIEPSSAEAHSLRGEGLFYMAKGGQDLPLIRSLHEMAEEALLTAIQLDSTLARAHTTLSELYRDQGRFQDAYRSALAGLEADPFHLSRDLVHERLCHTAFEARELGSAGRWCAEYRRREPRDLTMLLLQMNIDVMGSTVPQQELVDARADSLVALAAETYGRDHPSLDIFRAYAGLTRAKALARRGQNQQADSLLAAIAGSPGGIVPQLEYSAALVELLLGRRESALGRLERYFQVRRKLPEYWRADWYLEHLWGDPRFEALIQAPWERSWESSSAPPPPPT